MNALLLILAIGFAAGPCQAAIGDRADFAVRFYLYTQSNPTSGQEIITADGSSVTASYFSGSRQTRIIIHGWNNDGSSAVGTTIRNAYLARGEFNVIVVDWSAGANSLFYGTAKGNVADAGMRVAQFMNFLNSFGASSNKIYLIGHDLGAHVCGFAGKYANAKPNTIFGLDAALPLFNINDPSSRLADTDAVYVQSIHTDAGRRGFYDPLGNSSFYPAWGAVQPGCGLHLFGSCSHDRSYKYFAESLKVNNEFLGLKCGSIANIQGEICGGSTTGRMGGEPSNHEVLGLYYVPVNSNTPFATGNV